MTQSDHIYVIYVFSIIAIKLRSLRIRYSNIRWKKTPVYFMGYSSIISRSLVSESILQSMLLCFNTIYLQRFKGSHQLVNATSEIVGKGL